MEDVWQYPWNEGPSDWYNHHVCCVFLYRIGNILLLLSKKPRNLETWQIRQNFKNPNIYQEKLAADYCFNDCVSHMVKYVLNNFIIQHHKLRRNWETQRCSKLLEKALLGETGNSKIFWFQYCLCQWRNYVKEYELQSRQFCLFCTHHWFLLSWCMGLKQGWECRGCWL